MKKISRKFRLATVLKIAKLEEEKQQRATAEAVRVQDAAAALEAAREEAYQARATGEGDGPISAALFQQLTQSARLKADALHVAHAENIDASTRLELAREDLMARARKTHTLQDLEERHNVAYAVHAALAAQRTLDDLVRARRVPR